jgi:hypothetical protein
MSYVAWNVTERKHEPFIPHSAETRPDIKILASDVLQIQNNFKFLSFFLSWWVMNWCWRKPDRCYKDSRCDWSMLSIICWRSLLSVCRKMTGRWSSCNDRHFPGSWDVVNLSFLQTMGKYAILIHAWNICWMWTVALFGEYLTFYY